MLMLKLPVIERKYPNSLEDNDWRFSVSWSDFVNDASLPVMPLRLKICWRYFGNTRNLLSMEFSDMLAKYDLIVSNTFVRLPVSDIVNDTSVSKVCAPVT